MAVYIFGHIYESGVFWRVSAASSVLSTVHKAMDHFWKTLTSLNQYCQGSFRNSLSLPHNSVGVAKLLKLLSAVFLKNTS